MSSNALKAFSFPPLETGLVNVRKQAFVDRLNPKVPHELLFVSSKHDKARASYYARQRMMEILQAFCLEVCEKIYSGLTAHMNNTSQLEERGSVEKKDSIYECDPAILSLLMRQANILCHSEGNWELLRRRLDDLKVLANAKFYAYPFKDVPECWRRLFTDASILKACSVALRDPSKRHQSEDMPHNSTESTQEVIDEMTETLDFAIIMTGSPGAQRREWIEKMMEMLEVLSHICVGGQERRSPKRRKLDNPFDADVFAPSEVPVPLIRHPVGRISVPSLFAFEKYMYDQNDPQLGPEPLIITDAIDHWPARNERSWKRPSYLLSKTLNGRRLVPVEIGRSYVDEGWGQKIITFKKFMQHYLVPPFRNASNSSELSLPIGDNNDSNPNDFNENSSTGYLAQHDLFTQIPSLRADISVPDYCYTTPPRPHLSSPLAIKHRATPLLEEPLLNAWLGPAGTISPMHVDPYHNILAQVVGRKYVRLYAPRESDKLYARGVEDGGVDMENTSQVDVGILEGWDGMIVDQEEARMRFPLFEHALFVDLVIEEGECLYIPVGWWHYVRSLSVSFSVSFWWN